MPKNRKIEAAIKLLEQNEYSVTAPPGESDYQKALRTGKKPAIWPPIVMTQDDLNHFRSTHGITLELSHRASDMAKSNLKAQLKSQSE